jgi:hypothetical protein
VVASLGPSLALREAELLRLLDEPYGGHSADRTRAIPGITSRWLTQQTSALAVTQRVHPYLRCHLLAWTEINFLGDPHMSAAEVRRRTVAMIRELRRGGLLETGDPGPDGRFAPWDVRQMQR